MIHIKKSVNKKTGKNRFRVVQIAANGKCVNVATKLDTKQAAWKNIKAASEDYHYNVSAVNIFIRVQDDTGKKPIMFLWDTRRPPFRDLDIQAVAKK